MICKHFLVHGRVQNVFFRDSTRRKAAELNITGWVKNLDDGRVEVLAYGNEANIKALESWLWQGPPAAKVLDVVSEDGSIEEFVGFEVR
jgi:acylphosphatase